MEQQHFGVIHQSRITPRDDVRIQYFACEEKARQVADQLHLSPHAVNVEMHSYPYSGPKTAPSPTDLKLGAWLAAAAVDPGVRPSVKFDINQWFDSKEWT